MSKSSIGTFFLISLFCTTTFAQENFNIRQSMNKKMIREYSVEIADEFSTRVTQFNQNHKDLNFFLKEYKEDKDRRFLEQYLERHMISSFLPLVIQEGKAVSIYGAVRMEIGPVEALENKVILDGKSYSLSHLSGLRSRIVELEGIVEMHLKERKSTGDKIRNIFSQLPNFLPSLIATAHAQEEVKKERFHSQSLVAALIVSGDKLHLKKDVKKDWTGQAMFENVELMLNHFQESNKKCQDDLVNLRAVRAHDLEQNESYIPVASLNHFAFAGELNARLEEVEDRDLDVVNFSKMVDSLESHFHIRFTSQLDRNVCWGLFSRSFIGGRENPKIDNACNSFDQLHDCLVEMRHIDKVSESQRENVSVKFYEGRLPKSVNPYRQQPSSAQGR